ncbi:hypothetical protein ACOME3_007783 [Neoechinorhynchus agilis]
MAIRVPLANVRTPFSTSTEITTMMSIQPPPPNHIRICTQHFAMVSVVNVRRIGDNSGNRNTVFTLLLALYNQFVSACNCNVSRRCICQLSYKLATQGCSFGPKDQQRRLDKSGNVVGRRKLVVSDSLFVQLLHALHFIIYNDKNIDDAFKAVVGILKRAENEVMVESLLVARAVRRCFEASSSEILRIETDVEVFSTSSRQPKRQPALSFSKTTAISGRYATQQRPSSPAVSSEDEGREANNQNEPLANSVPQPSAFIAHKSRRSKQSFLSTRRKSKYISEESDQIELKDDAPGLSADDNDESDDDSRLSVTNVVRLPFLRQKLPTRTAGTPLIRTITKRRRTLYSALAKLHGGKK